MSFRTIISRIAVLPVLAALLSACGGGGGSGPDSSSEDAVILKLSYFRALPEPRTRKLEPNYRVVMSESWRDRMGEGPREPLAKAAPGKIYMGYIPDLQMGKYLKRLKEFGLDSLKPRNPDDFKPEDWGRACVDPQKSPLIRIFTVGNEKGAKSYLYSDQQTDKDSIEKFVKCEAFILRACEYAINVRATSDPLPGREK
jgi:hypothetical protein